MLPENEDDAAEVMVANVLPSKSEGTVGLGPTSIRLLPEPDNVMTETDSVAVPISVLAAVSSPLLWAAARPASHNSERVVPFMMATGMIVFFESYV
jgi:hypothetical protein